MKRSLAAACVLGSAAALLSSSAEAATRHYTGSELCTPPGYNFTYAPHGFTVCTTTTADYRRKAKRGTVKVSGRGETSFVFDASVYEVPGTFDYSYRFHVKKGGPTTVVVRKSKSYTVAYDTVCTVRVDLTFTKGVLVSAAPTNYCPDSEDD